MAYSYYGDNGLTSDDIKADIIKLKTAYPVKQTVACVRGWVSRPEPKGFITDLASDIAAVRNGGADGCAVFTYDSLLLQTSSPTLTSLKSKLGY